MDKIRQVVPYTPGEQPNKPDMIKLNTNENPYPPAPGAARALKMFNEDRLRLYPDPTSGRLTASLAESYGVDRDQVFVGVGSDDVLAIAFMTFFNSDKPIFFPDITYSFYPVWADLFKVPYETKALDQDFRIVKEEYYPDNGGVIFPNPNAPTSYAMEIGAVEDILRHNRDVIVIVDEAYIDFGGQSALRLLDKYENLLVVQTFSKSRSMAGMRIGYAMGHKDLIRAMNDVKYSFNSYTMNQTALILGEEALKDREYFQECIGKIKKTRAWSEKALADLGFSFPESSANFIFATHKTAAAEDIFKALREKDIYVRYFNLPRINNYLRITIGTDWEMEKLIEALKEILYDREG